MAKPYTECGWKRDVQGETDKMVRHVEHVLTSLLMEVETACETRRLGEGYIITAFPKSDAG